MGEVAPKGRPAFDGNLKTPSETVVVTVVGGHTILDEAVAGRDVRVRVWTNHPSEPDEVIIGLG
jgi:hypothetical protein